MITTVMLRIEHKKPVPDLLDKIAGRAYTIDGVDDVTASHSLTYEGVPVGPIVIDAVWEEIH
jgi:hypothetical protein